MSHVNASVRDYAQYIQLDLSTFPELAWIAEEGLNCPLPDGWTLVHDPSGHHFENASGKQQVDHPMDEHYRQLAKREIESLELTRLQQRISYLEPINTSGTISIESASATKSSTSRNHGVSRRWRFWWYLVIGSLLLHLVITSTVLNMIGTGTTTAMVRSDSVEIHVQHYVDHVSSVEEKQSIVATSLETEALRTPKEETTKPLHQQPYSREDDDEGWFW